LHGYGYGGVQIPFAFFARCYGYSGVFRRDQKAGRQNQRYATYVMLVGEEKMDGYSHQMKK
jgi:hypothetical protein